MEQKIGKDFRIYDSEWEIVRNYKDFCKAIEENYKEITHVSFDHDLADTHYDQKTWREGFKYHEETGEDCAWFLKKFYDKKDFPYPIMYVHSMNPIGAKRIQRVFKFDEHERSGDNHIG
jgi:hypothetical protein